MLSTSLNNDFKFWLDFPYSYVDLKDSKMYDAKSGVYREFTIRVVYACNSHNYTYHTVQQYCVYRDGPGLA